MTTTIYLITVFLLIACFIIIVRALEKEWGTQIVKLEKEIHYQDEMIITRDLTIKSLNREINTHADVNALLYDQNSALKSKLHRNRNEKGIFVKSEK